MKKQLSTNGATEIGGAFPDKIPYNNITNNLTDK